MNNNTSDKTRKCFTCTDIDTLNAVLTFLFSRGYHYGDDESATSIEAIKKNPHWGTYYQKWLALVLCPDGKIAANPNGTLLAGDISPISLTGVFTLPPLNSAPTPPALPVVVNIVLNESYTAAVRPDKVVVGCQSFPLVRIDELSAALDKAKGFTPKTVFPQFQIKCQDRNARKAIITYLISKNLRIFDRALETESLKFYLDNWDNDYYNNVFPYIAVKENTINLYRTSLQHLEHVDFNTLFAPDYLKGKETAFEGVYISLNRDCSALVKVDWTAVYVSGDTGGTYSLQFPSTLIARLVEAKKQVEKIY